VEPDSTFTFTLVSTSRKAMLSSWLERCPGTAQAEAGVDHSGEAAGEVNQVLLADAAEARILSEDLDGFS